MKLSQLLGKLNGHFTLTLYHGRVDGDYYRIMDRLEIRTDSADNKTELWNAEIENYKELKNLRVTDIYVSAGLMPNGSKAIVPEVTISIKD